MGCCSSQVAPSVEEKNKSIEATTLTPTPVVTTEKGADSAKNPASVVTADDLVKGSLLVLTRLSEIVGVGGEVVDLLTSIYNLWNSSHTKSIWCAEFVSYLQNIESDLVAGRSYLSDRYHLDRLTVELRSAQTTLDAVLSPSPSFVIDIVRIPFLQERLAQHRAALESVRSEALGSALIDAALDIQQARSKVDAILAQGGDLTGVVDRRDGIRSTAEASKDSMLVTGVGATGKLSNQSAATEQLGQIFSFFGKIYDTYKRLEETMKETKDEKKEKKDKKKAKTKDPPIWLSEFIEYLKQIESELRHAQLLVTGLKDPSNLSNYISTLRTNLETSQTQLKLIVERHAPVEKTFSVSRFLQLLYKGTDQMTLIEARTSLETTKASMLVTILTSLKAESAAFANEEMERLRRYMEQQDQNEQELIRMIELRRQADRFIRVMIPIDCESELKYEHRRFLKGTRRSVITMFRQFAGLIDGEGAGAGEAVTSQPRLDQQPLMLILASPGHGKTTFASHLIESYPETIIGVHFFRFDMATRRNVNKAIKSLAFQIAQRIPGLKPLMFDALRKLGVEVEHATTTTKNGANAEDTNTGGGGASKTNSNGFDDLTTFDLWDQIIVQPLWQLDEQRKKEAVLESTSSSSSSPSSDSESAVRPPPPPSRFILLLDAFDESETNGNNMFLKLLPLLSKGSKYALPEWLGIVMSTRPEGHVMRALTKYVKGPTMVNLDLLDQEETKVGTKSNNDDTTSTPVETSDIRFFFTCVTNTFMPDASSSSKSSCIDLLLRKSKGMFLYGRLILEQQGLDLQWLNREPDEIAERAARTDVYDDGWHRLTPEEIDAFPMGLNNFYLELLQRAAATAAATAPASASSTVGGKKSGNVAMVELKRILEFMVVSYEPLTLIQMKGLVEYSTWEEVLRRIELLRTIIQVKMRPTNDETIPSQPASPSNGTPNGTHILQLFHKSIRDWFVSSERLEDREESVYHIDEISSTKKLVTRSWNELQLQQQPSSNKKVEAIDLFNSPTPPTLDPSNYSTLRVEDACLPSRLLAQKHPFDTTLLSYAIRYLPIHLLQIGHTDDESLSWCALQLLIQLLSHLQYLHMRMSHGIILTSLSDRMIDDADRISSTNHEVTQLIKEFKIVKNRLRKMKKNNNNITDPETVSTPPTPLDPLRMLNSFDRFFRGEYPKLIPALHPNTNTSSSLRSRRSNYCGTLQGIYQYATSYPNQNQVMRQAECMKGWIDTWRQTVMKESKLAADAAFTSAATAAATVTSQSHSLDSLSSSSSSPLFPRTSRPLPSGWVRWCNKPTSLPSCLTTLHEVGSVSSLAIGEVANSQQDEEMTTNLFAVAHEGGTFGVYDLETQARIIHNEHGIRVGFDCRPRPLKKNSKDVEPARNDDDDDGDDPPVYVVSCDAMKWQTIDLSPFHSGERSSANINWSAAKQHAQLNQRNKMPQQQMRHGGLPPMMHQQKPQPFQQPARFGGPPAKLQYAHAPIADRTLCAQFGSDDLTCETFLCNRGVINPFPSSELTSRVTAVCFSHDGELCFVSQQNQSRLTIFSCNEWNIGREPSKLDHIYIGQGNAHATCLAITRHDDYLARGGSDGSIGVWRRQRTTRTVGEGENQRSVEDNKWNYIGMTPNHGQTASRDGGVGSIAISDDGKRILASYHSSIQLFDVETTQSIATFIGHADRIGAIAITSNGDYGISGGAGIDKTVRIWDLTDINVRPASSSSTGADGASGVVSVIEPVQQVTQKRTVRMCMFDSKDGKTLYWNGDNGTHRLTLDDGDGDGSSYLASPPIVVRHSARTPIGMLLPTDSNHFLGCDTIDDLELWNISEQRLLQTFKRFEDDLIGSSSMTRSTTADVRTGEVTSLGAIRCIRVTTCGRYVFGGGFHTDLYVWRTSDGKPIKRINLTGTTPEIMWDMELIEVRDNTPTRAEADGINGSFVDYMLVVPVPIGSLQMFRIRISNKDDDDSADGMIIVDDTPIWRTPLPPSTIRSIKLYEPIDSDERLLLVGTSTSVIHILSLNDGRLRYTFSIAPSMRIGYDGDDIILKIAILDRRGTFITNQNKKSLSDSSSSEPATSSSSSSIVQLLTLGSTSGVQIWRLDTIIAAIAATTAAPVPSVTIDAGKKDDSPPIALSPPPELAATVRPTRQQFTQMDVNIDGRMIAIGAQDGSMFICKWTEIDSQDQPNGNAPTPPPPSGPVVWRGAFDFQPAQRIELSGLIAHIECQHMKTM